MKTTNRIRRNGVTKPATSQVKTSRRKPENGRIVINDAEGKAFADFEITKAMHRAIERDCQAKGISPMCWIENATREHLKKFTPAEPSPTPANQAPQIAELITPSEIVIECKDALSLLKEAGNAAGALLMLNADLIKDSFKAHDGWQPFDVPSFSEGAQELARMTVCEFHSVIKELSGYIGGIVSQIEGCNEPIKAVSRHGYFNLLKGREAIKASQEIENIVLSLKHCIEIQSSALSSRHNEGAYSIGISMKERLDAAFKAIWAAIGKLENAYLAATVQYDPAGTERRMAA